MRSVFAVLLDPAAIFGGAGLFATLSTQDVVAIMVGLATVLSLVPVIVVRWRRMLRGESPETKNPFPSGSDES